VIAAHAGHGSGGVDGTLPLPSLLPLVILLASAYLVAAHRTARKPGTWRTASWLAGCTALGLAFSPVLPGSGGPMAETMRHLLLGMVAPLGLVLAAPVTLLLRTSGTPVRRAVARVLRSRALQVISHPATAALLNVGGLYVVMLTSVGAAAAERPWLQLAVQLHYLAAGYLFAWSIAGPDPAPHRPGVRTRLIVLFASMAAHSYLAKVLYARAPTAEGRAAAQLMYYGGDLVELLLAAALFHAWFRRRGRSRVVVSSRSPAMS
jgi:putative membrane protein